MGSINATFSQRSLGDRNAASSGVLCPVASPAATLSARPARYWEDDPATSVVALYIESFAIPTLRADRAPRGPPHSVLLSQGGATAAGARAARLHHAASAPPTPGVMRSSAAGVLRTRTLSEFLDLPPAPRSRGRSPRVPVARTRGLGILFADACGFVGLERRAPRPRSTASRLAAGREQPGESDRLARICYAATSRPCCRSCSAAGLRRPRCAFVRPVVRRADFERALSPPCRSGHRKPLSPCCSLASTRRACPAAPLRHVFASP